MSSHKKGTRLSSGWTMESAWKNWDGRSKKWPCLGRKGKEEYSGRGNSLYKGGGTRLLGERQVIRVVTPTRLTGRWWRPCSARSEFRFQIGNNRESLKSCEERSCVICLNCWKDPSGSSMESGLEGTKAGCRETRVHFSNSSKRWWWS